MPQVGNLGSLIRFAVSDNQLLTFKNLTHEVKGRWASHSVIGDKPVREYLGPDTGSVTMEVQINSDMGVRPRSVIDSIEAATMYGYPMMLVIGGQRIGDRNWVITSHSQAWNKVIADGRLISATIKITLEEY